MNDGAAVRVSFATTQVASAWNDYIHRHPNATPYHDFAWVTSVEQAYGHQNVSLLATRKDDNGNEKVVGILPAIKMHIPLKGSTLCSLPYCDVGYALADSEQIREHLLTHLHDTFPQSAKHEYRDSQQHVLDEELPGQKVRMLLPLPGSSEELMAGFKSKLRSQIRKAEKNGLRFDVGCDQQLLNQFYQVFIYNMRKLGSPVHSKAWYQSLFEHYQSNMLISVVYTDNIPIGAGIVLLNKGKACIPWASTLAEYNRLAPNMLLYWSLLEYVSDNGCTQFDFGRSTFGEGTYKFKRQWGAEPVALNWYLPGHHNSERETTDNLAANAEPGKLRTLVENTWSNMPIGLTTWLGPKVRKYISL